MNNMFGLEMNQLAKIKVIGIGGGAGYIFSILACPIVVRYGYMFISPVNDSLGMLSNKSKFDNSTTPIYVHASTSSCFPVKIR